MDAIQLYWSDGVWVMRCYDQTVVLNDELREGATDAAVLQAARETLGLPELKIPVMRYRGASEG